jgi:ParB family transcriptional regulator, chromosome partitioning protein
LAAVGSGEGVSTLAVADIRPHPTQPRRHFDEAALAELAASIAEQGVLQPILVRPSPDGVGYQLVAGERRWRASQRAGKHQIPALVRDLDDSTTFTIALVENIQRADLSAIEEAEAYVRLRDELGHSAEAIGRMTGKSRSHIANLLRLLELPAAVRALVADGSLGMGHARALIGATDAEALARRIVAEGLSVRTVEALLRDRRPSTQKPARVPLNGTGDADIAALETHLSDLLGLKVRIAHRSGAGGTLALDYSSLDQLDMLCQRLSGEGI